MPNIWQPNWAARMCSCLPACELAALRRAGKLRQMLRRPGLSPTTCADELGVTGRQARRLAAKLLQLEGYPAALNSGD